MRINNTCGQGSTVTSISNEFVGIDGYIEFNCDKYCVAGGEIYKWGVRDYSQEMCFKRNEVNENGR